MFECFLKSDWRGQILPRNSRSDILGLSLESPKKTCSWQIVPYEIVCVTCSKHWIGVSDRKGNVKSCLCCSNLQKNPLFMVLSLPSCTKNSALAILDFCATHSAVFLETWWSFKRCCVCLRMMQPFLFDDESWVELFQSYLVKRERFSVSICPGRNPLSVIASWLEFEVVWLCRCLINVFGAMEHTYEEWVVKAAFQFHSLQSRLVPLPSSTAYFCVFNEKRKKKKKSLWEGNIGK